MKFYKRALLLACFPAFFCSCGYRVAGKADLLPKNVHTISIPAFTNLTARYKLTDKLPQALAREFIARTRYQVVNDPQQADMVLTGAIINYMAYPTVFDQRTGRASGVQMNVTLQARVTERATGAILFNRPSFDARQRYEISVDQLAYFEESDAALDRLSRDVARLLVSAILENF